MMTTISFKAENQFKNRLQSIARYKGINISAYIKLTLTKEIKNELSQITENGLTVAEELAILHSAKNEPAIGPFDKETIKFVDIGTHNQVCK